MAVTEVPQKHTLHHLIQSFVLFIALDDVEGPRIAEDICQWILKHTKA